MDLKAILHRIETRGAELGLSARRISVLSTGSPDTVRNWQRAVAAGTQAAPNLDTIAQVASALQVTTRWLLDGDTDPAAPAPGLAEDAAPYIFREQPVPKDQQQLTLRAVFGDAAAHPATYRICTSLPSLGLWPGDVVVVDLRRAARDGELAIIGLPDGNTTVRRVMQPWLVAGDLAHDAPPMRSDQPGVTVRFPVIGSIRGLT